MAQEPAPSAGREVIRLANQPTLSPDGQTLVFAWGGDLWSVPTDWWSGSSR